LPTERGIARAQLAAEAGARIGRDPETGRRGTAIALREGMVFVLALLALVVTLADHWTTYLCLRTNVAGWEVTEANPLSQWLFQRFGLAGGLWIDTAVTLFILLVLVRTPRIPHVAKLAALAVLIATTAYAVANNLQAVQVLGIALAGS
jgi:hypothetical protein